MTENLPFIVTLGKRMRNTYEELSRLFGDSFTAIRMELHLHHLDLEDPF